MYSRARCLPASTAQRDVDGLRQRESEGAPFRCTTLARDSAGALLDCRGRGLTASFGGPLSPGDHLAEHLRLDVLDADDLLQAVELPEGIRDASATRPDPSGVRRVGQYLAC